MLHTLKQHWPEYLIEAAGLGLFMLSACAFGTLLEHPGSPVRQAIGDPLARRVLMGLAMALTGVAIVYSPWGKRSGAHINPAVTLTFYRLGKIAGWDAAFYMLFQFAGGVLGTMLAAISIGQALGHPSVNYVATLPGARGVAVAFAAEVAITFILMTVILQVSNRMSIARYTGLFAASLVMTYISLEAPLSGMSMNPARSFGSATFALTWQTLWLYFSAPPLGMLLAAEVFVRWKGARAVLCAKLHHHNEQRCIFNCNFGACLGADAARVR
jgi:aquaporin Z